MSENGPSLATFATGGFLIASILIFSLVALPELIPDIYPQLRFGTIAIRATSTSGQLIGQPLVSAVEITVGSMGVHRVGIGEGTWITVIDTPTSLSATEIARTPASLVEMKVPIGDYNLLKLAFGNATAIVGGSNETLKTPAQELRVPTTFTITEGKRTSLIVDLSFDEAAVMVSRRFDPYVTVTVEQPGQAPLSTIASLKLLTSIGGVLSPGESKSSAFTIDSGSAIQHYLVHAESDRGVENTFDLEIVETGELWYDLTGTLWFLGGNLASGTYNMTVRVNDAAVMDVGVTVKLYLVPRITGDLPDAAFSGFVPADAAQFIQVNEFAVYLDSPGLYDFYLGARSGDYEFLVDNNPASVATQNQVVTLQLDSGLHTFQIFTDFSGSGRETSWSVGIIPVAESSRVLSREAMLATWLLVIAAIVFVADVSFRFIRRRLGSRVSKTMPNSDATLNP